MTPKDKLVEEARNFCKRVEAGEVRSKRTYAAFKALLALIDGVQGICPRTSRACEGGCGLGRICGHLEDNFAGVPNTDDHFARSFQPK